MDSISVYTVVREGKSLGYDNYMTAAQWPDTPTTLTIIVNRAAMKTLCEKGLFVWMQSPPPPPRLLAITVIHSSLAVRPYPSVDCSKLPQTINVRLHYFIKIKIIRNSLHNTL